MTTIAEALLREFAADSPRTRAMLAAVPEDRLGWQPHPKSMSLGGLAGHLAESPEWTESMLTEDLDMVAMQASYRPFVPASRAELLERFDAAVATFRGALEGRDDEHMRGTWRMKMGDQVLMERAREDLVRDFSVHHAIHHRGQLSVYLRLLDVAVPSTFGPTADDPTGGLGG